MSSLIWSTWKKLLSDSPSLWRYTFRYRSISMKRSFATNSGQFSYWIIIRIVQPRCELSLPFCQPIVSTTLVLQLADWDALIASLFFNLEQVGFVSRMDQVIKQAMTNGLTFVACRGNLPSSCHLRRIPWQDRRLRNGQDLRFSFRSRDQAGLEWGGWLPTGETQAWYPGNAPAVKSAGTIIQ